jgi:hypothetical protein
MQAYAEENKSNRGRQVQREPKRQLYRDRENQKHRQTEKKDPQVTKRKNTDTTEIKKTEADGNRGETREAEPSTGRENHEKAGK